jgi:Chaperone of endosialidase
MLNPGSSSNNTGVGSYVLEYSIGNDNTAVGTGAQHNVDASDNTAIGSGALEGSTDMGRPNSTGSFNTATGMRLHRTALAVLTPPWAIKPSTPQRRWRDLAGGWLALYSNTSGQYNTGLGVSALRTNTIGNQNTATGTNALYHSTGNNNTALGFAAGQNLTTGSSNIIIGANVLGASTDANVTRIGASTQKKTFIGGIYNKTVASGVGVIVNSSGQLGTVQSSARYKDDIKPMDKASETILALKPITFRYKEELDPDHVPQFGLIAEEVEKVNPDLIVRDEDGKVMTVRYDAVNAMLLNEFLKEQHKVEEYGRELVRQKEKAQEQAATIAQMKKQIDALAGGLQKVSEQVELSKRAPQLASKLP